MPKPAAVILAAGLSRRMGRQKLLLPVNGEPLLALTVADVSRAWGGTPLVVVPPSGPVHALAGTLGCPVIVNPDPASGIGSSLAVAARHLAGRPGGLLVFLGDQPGVPAVAVTAVVQAAAEGDGLLAVDPLYQGVPGHPVWLSSALLAELSELSGDQGARFLIKRLEPARVQVLTLDIPLPPDLDTPRDYAEWQRRFPAE